MMVAKHLQRAETTSAAAAPPAAVTAQGALPGGPASAPRSAEDAERGEGLEGSNEMVTADATLLVEEPEQEASPGASAGGGTASRVERLDDAEPPWPGGPQSAVNRGAPVAPAAPGDPRHAGRLVQAIPQRTTAARGDLLSKPKGGGKFVPGVELLLGASPERTGAHGDLVRNAPACPSPRPPASVVPAAMTVSGASGGAAALSRDTQSLDLVRNASCVVPALFTEPVPSTDSLSAAGRAGASAAPGVKGGHRRVLARIKAESAERARSRLLREARRLASSARVNLFPFSESSPHPTEHDDGTSSDATSSHSSTSSSRSHSGDELYCKTMLSRAPESRNATSDDSHGRDLRTEEDPSSASTDEGHAPRTAVVARGRGAVSSDEAASRRLTSPVEVLSRFARLALTAGRPSQRRTHRARGGGGTKRIHAAAAARHAAPRGVRRLSSQASSATSNFSSSRSASVVSASSDATSTSSDSSVSTVEAARRDRVRRRQELEIRARGAQAALSQERRLPSRRMPTQAPRLHRPHPVFSSSLSSSASSGEDYHQVHCSTHARQHPVTREPSMRSPAFRSPAPARPDAVAGGLAWAQAEVSSRPLQVSSGSPATASPLSRPSADRRLPSRSPARRASEVVRARAAGVPLLRLRSLARLTAVKENAQRAQARVRPEVEASSQEEAYQQRRRVALLRGADAWLALLTPLGDSPSRGRLRTNSSSPLSSNTSSSDSDEGGRRARKEFRKECGAVGAGRSTEEQVSKHDFAADAAGRVEAAAPGAVQTPARVVSSELFEETETESESEHETKNEKGGRHTGFFSRWFPPKPQTSEAATTATQGASRLRRDHRSGSIERGVPLPSSPSSPQASHPSSPPPTSLSPSSFASSDSGASPRSRLWTQQQRALRRRTREAAGQRRRDPRKRASTLFGLLDLFPPSGTARRRKEGWRISEGGSGAAASSLATTELDGEVQWRPDASFVAVPVAATAVDTSPPEHTRGMETLESCEGRRRARQSERDETSQPSSAPSRVRGEMADNVREGNALDKASCEGMTNQRQGASAVGDRHSEEFSEVNKHDDPTDPAASGDAPSPSAHRTPQTAASLGRRFNGCSSSSLSLSYPGSSSLRSASFASQARSSPVSAAFDASVPSAPSPPDPEQGREPRAAVTASFAASQPSGAAKRVVVDVRERGAARGEKEMGERAAVGGEIHVGHTHRKQENAFSSASSVSPRASSSAWSSSPSTSAAASPTASSASSPSSFLVGPLGRGTTSFFAWIRGEDVEADSTEIDPEREERAPMSSALLPPSASAVAGSRRGENFARTVSRLSPASGDIHAASGQGELATTRSLSRVEGDAHPSEPASASSSSSPPTRPAGRGVEAPSSPRPNPAVSAAPQDSVSAVQPLRALSTPSSAPRETRADSRRQVKTGSRHAGVVQVASERSSSSPRSPVAPPSGVLRSLSSTASAASVAACDPPVSSSTGPSPSRPEACPAAAAVVHFSAASASLCAGALAASPNCAPAASPNCAPSTSSSPSVLPLSAASGGRGAETAAHFLSPASSVSSPGSPSCPSAPLVDAPLHGPSLHVPSPSSPQSSPSPASFSGRVSGSVPEAAHRLPTSKFRWVDLDRLPLTSQVAFDDLTQAMRRRACAGHLQGACCCCIGCSTDCSQAASGLLSSLSVPGDAFETLKRDGMCTCFCGTCCCTRRLCDDETDAGVKRLSTATGHSSAFPREAPDLSFLFEIRDGGALRSSSGMARSPSALSQGGLSASAHPSIAAFLASRIPSFHAGLPPARLAELQARASTQLAATVANQVALAARLLVHAPANELVIPSLDLFLNQRKVRSLMGVPSRNVVEQLLRILGRFPRFALPLYDTFLLEQVCEDPVLHPRLQGLEIPFRLLTHDFVFLGSYAYLADLPPWSRPPVKVLRVYKFQQLQLVDTGETREEATASATARQRSSCVSRSSFEDFDLEGEDDGIQRGGGFGRRSSVGSDSGPETYEEPEGVRRRPSMRRDRSARWRGDSHGTTTWAPASPERRPLGCDSPGGSTGAGRDRETTSDRPLQAARSCAAMRRPESEPQESEGRGAGKREEMRRRQPGRRGGEDERLRRQPSERAGADARPVGGTYSAPTHGARPDDLEAEHLQGLAFYNLKLMMGDFAETLEIVELHYGEMFYIEGDVFAYFRGVTTFMDSQNFRLESIKCRRRDGPPIVLTPSGASASPGSASGVGESWRGEAARRTPTRQVPRRRRGERGEKGGSCGACQARQTPSSGDKACGICCRCRARQVARDSSSCVTSEEEKEPGISFGWADRESRVRRGSSEDDEGSSSDEEQGGWRGRRQEIRARETDNRRDRLRRTRGGAQAERQRSRSYHARGALETYGSRKTKPAETETEDDGAGNETDDEDIDGFVRTRTLVDRVYGPKDEGGIGSGIARTFTNIVRALDMGSRRRTDIVVEGAPLLSFFSSPSLLVAPSRLLSGSPGIGEEASYIATPAKWEIHSVTYVKKPRSPFPVSTPVEETERSSARGQVRLRRDASTATPPARPSGRAEGRDEQAPVGERGAETREGSDSRDGRRPTFLGYLLGDDDIEDDDPLAFFDGTWY
ncbi:hypothetical protein BESB_016640 [Besnoitia besnoiti]|uniref:Uncharacterized protein n=1 Tax=Besnoitia besnoiti TaxID=94643 RepID=A0A2A9M8X1_BESBE|nr:hypothetical protein BESB_016640 [Besnoitia besnoiti]PFH32346.1 hypothetical protein BESB_016640 [Besnoitia besnoiti]